MRTLGLSVLVVLVCITVVMLAVALRTPSSVEAAIASAGDGDETWRAGDRRGRARRARAPGASATQSMSDADAAAEAKAKAEAEAARAEAERHVREQLGEQGDEDSAWVEEITAEADSDGGFDVQVVVTVRDDDDQLVRRRYDVDVSRGARGAGGTGGAGGNGQGEDDWHAAAAGGPVEFDAEAWLQFEHVLQSRAMEFVRDTKYAESPETKIHATPVGRGRFDVVAIYDDPANPGRRRIDFLMAEYDPVDAVWRVEAEAGGGGGTADASSGAATGP